jgi:hypothetical protein
MSENPYRQDNPFVSDESFVDKIKRLEAENLELQRKIHILNLSIPLEEELQERAYDLLARMHLPQGWSTVEVAQLIMDMQKRIVADWIKIGHLMELTQENQRLRSEIMAHTQRMDEIHRTARSVLDKYPQYERPD